MCDEDVAAIVIDNGSGRVRDGGEFSRTSLICFLQVCAKLASPVMMLLDRCFHPLLDDHVIKPSWSVWVKKIRTSVMKLNPNVVFSP